MPKTKEETNAYHREWCRRNREKRNAWKKAYKARRKEKFPELVAETSKRTRAKWWRKIKLAVITKYGGKCTCCGEATLEFLTIDHITFNGKEDRWSKGDGAKFYMWLRDNEIQPDLQVLCMNCNWGTRYGSACPHTRGKT